jgi:serine/threonine-protein kinase
MVALKVPSAAVMEDESFLQRFEREAMTVARFHHDNIVMIHDVFVGESEGERLAYISMEFVDGEEIDDHIKRRHWELTVGDILDLLRQCCEGVESAHRQGVVHRDLKPANIFVAKRDAKIKIMDFGIARITGATALTMTGTVMGTPYYMSPEQIKGEELGPPSDIYALAVMTFQLLTMRHLFEGETTTLIFKHISEPPPPPTSVNTNLPPALDAALLRGLAKEPRDRMARATELAEALEHALGAHRATPYHQMLSLSREKLMELGIPPSPPAADGSTVMATRMGTPRGSSPVSSPAIAPPPPRSAPTPPPSRATSVPPPATWSPAQASVSAATPAERPPTESGAHRASTAALSAAKATGKVSRVATAKVAVPTVKFGGKALVALITTPFKLIWKLPPKGRAIAIVVLMGAVGLLALNAVMGREGRQGITSGLRGAIGSAWNSVAGESENQPPQLSPAGAPPLNRPLTRVEFIRMLNQSVRFTAHDPENRLQGYRLHFDDRPPVIFQMPPLRAADWERYLPRVEAGQHRIQVVALDQEGLESPPIGWTFETTEAWP